MSQLFKTSPSIQRVQLRAPRLAASVLTAGLGCQALIACDLESDQLEIEQDAASELGLAEFPRTTFVHLFEWSWPDVAQECEEFLGPKGFAAVQVSPPQEHIDPPGNADPWWTRYQPVSYQLISRSGNEAEFIDMVQRCRAAGVDVYVDAVINHMTGSNTGVGTAGTVWNGLHYPGLYGPWHFNECDRNITNYNDRWEVQHCRLVGLRDLATGSHHVRQTLANYLQRLVDMGVAGFRIDASKHMPAGDIADILGRVHGDFYVFQEVIDQGGEAVSAHEYLGNGDITEFRYSVELSRVFQSGDLRWLANFGEGWSFLPSTSAVVFVDNHDNQRGHGGGGDIITHQDGSLYDLVNGFMLAWPYGYPKIMSSFAFTDTEAGPPVTPDGRSAPVHAAEGLRCFSDGWQCEHRRTPIANMVEFKNVTQGVFQVNDFVSEGPNRIAFARGDRGFFAMQRGGHTWSRWFTTALPAGRYCNVFDSNPSPDGGHCERADGSTAPSIQVWADTRAFVSVSAGQFVALHQGSRLSVD